MPEFDLYNGNQKKKGLEPSENEYENEDFHDTEAEDSQPKQRKQIFDIDYQDLSFAGSRRNINQKNRNKAFPDMMSKAARQLKKLNSKALFFEKADKDKAVEVTEDP